MAFMRKIFGGNDDKYEKQPADFNEEIEDNTEEEELDYEEPAFTGASSKVVSMPTSSSNSDAKFNMIIFNPVNYDQAQGIVDSLKQRKPIIVNLDDLDVGLAQRILDFTSGAVYALGGDIKKAAKNIFLVVPSNVEVATEIGENDPYEEM
mgnify:CR=1 FL=1